MEEIQTETQTRAAKIGTDILKHAAVLTEKLLEWVDLPFHSGMAQMSRALEKLWFTHSIVYIFAWITCLEYKDDPEFFKSDLYVCLVAGLAGQIRNITMESLPNSSPLPDTKELINQCMKELTAAKKEVLHFIDNIANGVKEPDAPMIGLLIHRIGVSGPKQGQVEENIRQFTKDLLRKLAT